MNLLKIICLAVTGVYAAIFYFDFFNKKDVDDTRFIIIANHAVTFFVAFLVILSSV